MDMVPGLKHNSIIILSKFEDEKYITIFTEGEVIIYDGNTAKTTISKHAVLRRWICKNTWLWIITLKKSVKNVNTDKLFIDWLEPTDTMKNVYELASTQKTIQYLHAYVGFLTKETWMKEIIVGNYYMGPVLTAKDPEKSFPDPDET